jgi:tetratricopeptide (TPR) repeat protein
MKNIIMVMVVILIPALVLAQTAKEYTQRGRELLEKREYVEALVNLNKAIELDPNQSAAYFLRGNIKDNFEDRHGAMKDYNLAIEKNAKFGDALFARGNVKMKLQDYYVLLMTTQRQ